MTYKTFAASLLAIGLMYASGGALAASACDKICLERIGDQYRAAYLKHDPKLAPFARNVRFTENHVELEFPDGTWDTVTQEVGPAVTFSDPQTGGVGIYTTIVQNDTPGFLAIRLKVHNGQIAEVEHIVSTKRNLSSPPTPIGDINTYAPEPIIATVVPPAERASRKRLIELGNGYFDTLQHNTGEIHTKFSPDAVRLENGLKFTDIEGAFKLGRYRFNERVRDRDPVVIDEERGLVMFRGFIDHKGVLDEYTLTDGTKRRSEFREPQTWAFLETFKVKNDRIVSVQATFFAAPYYMRAPWTRKLDRRAK